MAGGREWKQTYCAINGYPSQRDEAIALRDRDFDDGDLLIRPGNHIRPVDKDEHGE